MGDPETSEATRYWRTNLQLVGLLLAVWFVVSYGAGILFVEPLNEIQMGGFPLGFWFAQQGSIAVFIVLILVYCLKMDAIDAAFSGPASEAPLEPSAAEALPETSVPVEEDAP